MIGSFFNKLVGIPTGNGSEAVLSCEGISWTWAFWIGLALAILIWWGYQKAAPQLSRTRRGFLVALRILLAVFFLLLLVRPVLLLTINETVRERLLVMLDVSQSMQIKDRRRTEDDQKRAALAVGLTSPESALKSPLPSGIEKYRDISRADLLRALASNERLNLWSRLQKKADLTFYSAGSSAQSLGGLTTSTESGAAISLNETKAFFDRLKFSEPLTGLGDSMRQMLEENRGQPITGVLVITDGANNAGTPPEEVAGMARQDGLPIYTYGIGIAEPKDIIVRGLTGVQGAFVKERAEFTAKVRALGFAGQTVKLQLKANGTKVDEKEIQLNGDAEAEYVLGYEPQEKGEAQIEMSIDPLDEESGTENNQVSTRIRILDSKVKVLYLESEPRWDFRYLLATLQRDRRLSVKCVLFQGEPELADEKDSPFLKEFPTERGDLVGNEIIVLGDVSPQTLGETRMKLINEWVSEMGGGLIFLAGPKNNPFRYAGTPLEPLLPVELATGLSEAQWAERSRTPIKLKLTPTGDLSSLLRLSEKPLENRQFWNEFPGVRWTARVSKARPTAQVFLADSTQEKANRDGLMPVIAQQPYGQGQVMYFGFDETYRWRSEIGEKYYLRIWSQVIQSFSLERQLGASARTQLKVERPEYLAGDKVVISGKIYTENFTPYVEANVPGTLTITLPDGSIQKQEPELLAEPDRPGEYRLEFKPQTAGEYRFSTLMDAKASLNFHVLAPRLEQGETAMNISLLQNMAAISGGKFLREEDLNNLPELIASRSATIPSFKKLELFYSPWWMALLMLLALTEWLFRRLWQLK